MGIKSVLGPISNYIQWFANCMGRGYLYGRICLRGFYLCDPKSYKLIKEMVVGLLKKKRG